MNPSAPRDFLSLFLQQQPQQPAKNQINQTAAVSSPSQMQTPTTPTQTPKPTQIPTFNTPQAPFFPLMPSNFKNPFPINQGIQGMQGMQGIQGIPAMHLLPQFQMMQPPLNVSGVSSVSAEKQQALMQLFSQNPTPSGEDIRKYATNLQLSPEANISSMNAFQAIMDLMLQKQNPIPVTAQSSINTLGAPPSYQALAQQFSLTPAAPADMEEANTKPEVEEAEQKPKAKSKAAKKPKQPKAAKPSSPTAELEKKLSAVLDAEGGIAKPENVAGFVKLMSNEKSTKSKSLLLTALDLTKQQPILKKFVESSGLNILNKWLEDAKAKPGTMKFILTILLKLPVTLESLKTSELGKTVKKYSKAEITDAEVKDKLAKCLTQWTELVKKPSKAVSEAKAYQAQAQLAAKISASASAEGSEQKGGLFSIHDSTIPKKKKPADGHRTVQAVDLHTEKRKIIKGPPTTSKPLSADDIRRQKLKEKHAQQQLQQQQSQQDSSASTSQATSSYPSNSTSPTAQQSNPLKRKLESIQEEQALAATEQSGEEPEKKKQRKKKKVTWANPDKLEQIKYFEKEQPLPEDGMSTSNEQASKSESLSGAKEGEMLLKERERKKVLENMKPTIDWQFPPVMDVVSARHVQTNQFISQSKRVMETPATRYTSVTQVPATPSSPLPYEQDYDDSLTPQVQFEFIPGAVPAPYTSTSSGEGDLLGQIAADPGILTRILGLINSDTSSSSSTTPAPSFPFQAPPQIPPQFSQAPQQVNFVPPGVMPVGRPYGMQPAPPGFAPMPPAGAPVFAQPPQQNVNYGRHSLETSVSHNGGNFVDKEKRSNSKDSYKSIRCRFFTTKIGCKNGDSCKYYHEGVDPIPEGGVSDFIPGYAQQMYGTKSKKDKEEKKKR